MSVNVTPLVKVLSGADAGRSRPLRSGDVPLNDDATVAFQQSYDLAGAPVFKQVAGTPHAEESFPDFAADGEALAFVQGTAASDQANIAWPGRLNPNQSKVKSIKVGIMGTGSYKLRVYVENNVPGWTLAYDSGTQAVPASFTALSLADTDLSAQPVSDKRYWVVVEATVNNAQQVNVSRPYLGQE